MEKSPVTKIKTKRDLAERISRSLIARGTCAPPELVLEITDAWLAGHWGPFLPAGSVGATVGAILDDIDDHLTGALHTLK